jgi:hypothetical protein
MMDTNAPEGEPARKAPDLKDACFLLQAAKEEIVSLRRQIQFLEPKAEAYDTLRKVIGLMPASNGIGYGRDVNWDIDRFLDLTALPATSA